MFCLPKTKWAFIVVCVCLFVCFGKNSVVLFSA